jgi:hypothetical protein
VLPWVRVPTPVSARRSARISAAWRSTSELASERLQGRARSSCP